MSEQQSKIFVCGYTASQSVGERQITQHTVAALQGQGAEIVNKDILDVAAKSKADSIALQKRQVALMNEADAGYGDLTFNNPDTIGHLMTMQNYLSKPVGVSYRENARVRTPTLFRMNTIYTWEHAQDFVRNARNFLSFVKAIATIKNEDRNSLDVLIQAQIDEGFIRTGELTIDLKKEKIAFSRSTCQPLTSG